MTNNSKIIYVMLIIFLLISLSGCWDLKEIEDRGYVLGIALDTYEDLGQELDEVEDMAPETGPKKYVMTIQIPIWKIGQAKEGAKGQKATWEMSVSGRSIMEMNREFSTRVGFPPFYHDLKVIVISKSLAERDVVKWADFPFRDSEFRRPVLLYVAKSALAKDILTLIPKIESYSSDYLSHLKENIFKNSRIEAPFTLGDFSNAIFNKGDFTIPLVNIGKGELKDAGAAIIKKNKMVGELTERETEGLNMLKNKYGGGTVVFPCWKHKRDIITAEITDLKTKIKPQTKNNQIIFTIDTSIKANIAEVTCSLDHDEFNEEFLKRVEENISKRMQSEIKDAIVKFQDLKADAGGLIGKVRISDYKYWKANKEKWSDEIFPKAKFAIKVKSNVEAVGLIK